MKIIRNSYALEFRVLPVDMDAIYFYSFDDIDLIIIHNSFQEDKFLVAQLITHLQKEIELKKRIKGGNVPVEAQCVIGDLDLDREPDFVIRNIGDFDEIDFPGGDVSIIGQAVPRESIKVPIGEARSYQQPKVIKGTFANGATYTVGDPAGLAFWESLDRDYNEEEIG